MQALYEEASSKLAASEQKVLDANSKMCQLESHVAKFRALVEVWPCTLSYAFDVLALMRLSL